MLLSKLDVSFPHGHFLKMGVTKTTHQEGTGAQPTPGQTVTIEYTGFLKDTSKPNNKGKQYVHPDTRLTNNLDHRDPC